MEFSTLTLLPETVYTDVAPIPSSLSMDMAPCMAAMLEFVGAEPSFDPIDHTSLFFTDTLLSEIVRPLSPTIPSLLLERKNPSSLTFSRFRVFPD